MSVTIKTIPEFDRRLKHLTKKYKSLKEDLLKLIQSLYNNPVQGVYLGKGGVYKIRMPIAAKGGGKSGGARILTYSITTKSPNDYEVTLLTIYDKGEIENVSDNYINSLLKGME